MADGANGEFRLIPPDAAWPSAVLFETPEQIFGRVYRTLRPRGAIPAVSVKFEPFAGPSSSIRLNREKIFVRISDLLEHAPAPVIEALAYILVSKLMRRAIPAGYAHRYRLFLNRREMRKLAHHTRQERGRKLYLDPTGATHDLTALFEQLNVEYFNGLMARPLIGWSYRISRTRLGHFDPSHNAIVISRIFDQPRVPRLALEYVMYHEMLHLQFPVDHSKKRRCVHTKEFKAAEQKFRGLEEAKKLLRELP